MFEDGKREPDFVNPEGVKWWIDKSLTEWATKPNIKGTRLPNVVSYVIEELNGNRSRVLVDKGVIVFDSQRAEDIAVHIDVMKLSKEFNSKS